MFKVKLRKRKVCQQLKTAFNAVKLFSITYEALNDATDRFYTSLLEYLAGR